MIAHIRERDGGEQSLLEHSENVRRLCSEAARKVGLARLAELIGLMHDMGKATRQFEAYLSRKIAVSPHHHAPAGAIYAYRRWFFTVWG